ncbi:hypothetical protein [Granulicoccus phenolivorans]|uniref:hypothetical protein n=1 Tax=Granulicoccus phenolivorans TaxID=266854 RepID=UPI00041B9232|nr:hypothetical protein [Granulicoccus phenolivorans]
MAERGAERAKQQHADPQEPSIQREGDSVTTGSLPVIRDLPPVPRRRMRRPALWLSVCGVITVLAGVIGGVVWALTVPLTMYTVNADGAATTTERGLANYIAGDAYFVVIGAVLSLAYGFWIWKWFSRFGWVCVLLAVFGSLLMALTAWQFGWLIGPGNFADRLAQAQPGATLPIELTLRAESALLAWPLFASMMVMLCASVSRDPELPGRRRNRVEEAPAAGSAPSPSGGSPASAGDAS